MHLCNKVLPIDEFFYLSHLDAYLDIKNTQHPSLYLCGSNIEIYNNERMF